MCCGQKREALRNSAAAGTTSPAAAEGNGAAKAAPMNLYYLRNVPVRLRGSATGRPYDFSSARPVQAVDPRDAVALLRTRFFRGG